MATIKALDVSLLTEFASNSQEPCNIRTCVSLQAMQAPKRDADLRLMLVLDTSGSMSGDRIELVQATTK